MRFSRDWRKESKTPPYFYRPVPDELHWKIVIVLDDLIARPLESRESLLE
jgi:hypothetical protein